MIIVLPSESTMITDSEAPDMQENPVVVSNYKDGEGILLTGHEGDTIYMSYRQVKEVCKQMTEFANPKKKK